MTRVEAIQQFRTRLRRLTTFATGPTQAPTEHSYQLATLTEHESEVVDRRVSPPGAEPPRRREVTIPAHLRELTLTLDAALELTEKLTSDIDDLRRGLADERELRREGDAKRAWTPYRAAAVFALGGSAVLLGTAIGFALALSAVWAGLLP